MLLIKLKELILVLKLYVLKSDLQHNSKIVKHIIFN